MGGWAEAEGRGEEGEGCSGVVKGFTGRREGVSVPGRVEEGEGETKGVRGEGRKKEGDRKGRMQGEGRREGTYILPRLPGTVGHQCPECLESPVAFACGGWREGGREGGREG